MRRRSSGRLVVGNMTSTRSLFWLESERRLWPREQGYRAASQDRPTADCRGIDAALLDRRGAGGVLLGLLAGGSSYSLHGRRGQTPGCRHNRANSSVRRPRHIQHHEFRRNAPSQWHATRPNAAGHIEILSSLPNEPVRPTQWCLASIFQNPDARQADLAAMRVSGKCQMGSAWYVREPHRSGLKARASATMPSRRATSSEWEPV
jgi:hypothetical protein